MSEGLLPERPREREIMKPLAAVKHRNIDAVAFIYSPIKMTATIVLSNPQINTNYITTDWFLTGFRQGGEQQKSPNTETKKKHFFFF